MALEYVYYGSADLGTAQLHTVLAGLLDGRIVDDITVERDGLSVASWRETPGEEARAASLFGFPHRITAIFRFHNLGRELEDHNTAVMIGCVLGILQQTHADGVLLFNGEEAVLRCVDGEAIFSEDWDWDDWPEAAAIRSGHRVARLVQPLL